MQDQVTFLRVIERENSDCYSNAFITELTGIIPH